MPSGTLGLMLAVATAFITEFARRRRESRDHHYQEFLTLTRQAWDDIRHPGRWMRKADSGVSAGDR